MINDMMPVSYTVYFDLYLRKDNKLINHNTKYTLHKGTPPNIGDKIYRNGLLFYEIIIDVVNNYTKKQERIIKINNLKIE